MKKCVICYKKTDQVMGHEKCNQFYCYECLIALIWHNKTKSHVQCAICRENMIDMQKFIALCMKDYL